MIPRPDFPYPAATYYDDSSSTYGHPKINRKTASIRVPVLRFVLDDNYPGPAEHRDKYFRYAILIFEDVARSEREISELVTPGGKEFKSPYAISDGPFPEVDKQLFVFYLAGPLDDPLGIRQFGWIEWYIAAASLRIESGGK